MNIMEILYKIILSNINKKHINSLYYEFKRLI